MVAPEKMNCYVVSDLHLFSRRSLANDHEAAIYEAAAQADILVLAGDIFDFKWSHFGSFAESTTEASAWLRRLIDASPYCQIHYLLGNHDHHPLFVEELGALSAEHENLSWHPYHLRLGSAVFLHGDAANPRMNQARLEAFRSRFAHHRQAGAQRNRMYDFTVSAGLHILGARLAFPRRRTLRRITRYLDEIGEGWADGVRNVYFGHTHRRLADEEFRDLKFHNGGAPMKGMDFEVVSAQLG